MNPSPNTLTKRFALLLLAGLLLAVAHGAQPPQDPVLQYYARVASAGANLSPKPLFVAITNQLPGGDVAHDRDHHLLIIRTTERISFTELQGWMTNSGFVLLHLTTDANDVRTHINSNPFEAVPEYTDTGNSEQDDVLFMEAVSAWMQAHPMNDLPNE